MRYFRQGSKTKLLYYVGKKEYFFDDREKIIDNIKL